MDRPTVPGLTPPLAINSIFCIGRNYVEHAKELNNEVPDEPVVFLKPVSSIILNGGTISLPDKTNNVHHEVELVAAIGKEGKNIPERRALEHIAGYGIGIDVTARDLQSQAKKAGKPWTIAKGFDTFAPISDFLPSEQVEDPRNLDLTLSVNGKMQQKGSTGLMIFSIPELVAYLSGIFTLYPGDLIFTGTPAGVSAIQAGDKIEAVLGGGLTSLSVSVKKEL